MEDPRAWAPSTPPTQLSGLEKLPSPLLESICGYLPGNGSKSRSILAFALTSKTCCSAADKERFRHVQVPVRGPKKLRRDVQRWRAVLEVNHRVKYVRMLKISGWETMTRAEDEEDEENEDKGVKKTFLEAEPGGSSKNNNAHNDDLDDNHNTEEWKEWEEWSDGDKPKKEQPVPFYMPALPWPEEERKAYDEAWLPLAQLCGELSGLQDIVYAHYNQIPRCLLSVLHESHPQIRLHMQTFKLRSLGSHHHPDHEAYEAHAVHPDELILATSPCLYSLTVAMSASMRITPPDYNEEAVLHMVKGLAPKLTHVRSWQAYIGAQHIPRHAGARQRPKWQGFPSSSLENYKSCVGRLQSLFLDGASSAVLVKWSNHTDFHELRSLDIRNGITMDGLQQLERMARRGLFTNLYSLSLELMTGFGEHRREIDQAAAELLQVLGPLKDLTLTGGFVNEKILDAIINCHAGSLHQLNLSSNKGEMSFMFSSSHAQQFLLKCHQLEELKLLVPRLQGKEEEKSVYQCLGRLPRLKRLTLLLDCSVRTHTLTDEEVDDVDNNNDRRVYIRGGQGVSLPLIQEAFLNAAIDSVLALDIFCTLTKNSTSLRAVRLQPCGWPLANGLDTFMRWVGRQWVIQRNFRGEIQIRETDVEGRLEAGKHINGTTQIRMMGDVERNRDMAKAAWEGLWPRKSDNWLDDWSSFPLTQDPLGPGSPGEQKAKAR